jgi:hypothetical protein
VIRWPVGADGREGIASANTSILAARKDFARNSKGYLAGHRCNSGDVLSLAKD